MQNLKASVYRRRRQWFQLLKRWIKQTGYPFWETVTCHIGKCGNDFIILFFWKGTATINYATQRLSFCNISTFWEKKKSNEPYGQTLVHQTFYNPKCHTVDEDILFQTQYLLCCVSEYFDYASKISIICFIENLKLLTDRWKINAILWDQVSLHCSMRCHTSATSAVFVLSVSVLETK